MVENGTNIAFLGLNSPHFKIYNLVSVRPKSIILGQMTNVNMIFHMVVSLIDWLTFETRPSSLLNLKSSSEDL